MGDPISMTAEELAELDWAPMRSTNIHELAYAPDGEAGALFARFAGGGVYRYDGVAPAEHETLLEAHRDPHRSVGRTLRSRIQGAHDYHRVDVPE